MQKILTRKTFRLSKKERRKVNNEQMTIHIDNCLRCIKGSAIAKNDVGATYYYYYFWFVLDQGSSYKLSCRRNLKGAHSIGI